MQFPNDRKGTSLLRMALILLFAVQIFAQSPATAAGSAVKISKDSLIQPEDLAKELQSSAKSKPLVLAVGPHSLFTQGHVQGAEYVGAGSTAEGIEKLRTRVKTVAKARRIVLYCGCCPWGHCPNIAPAMDTLHSLGFTNVKALYIENNL